jgi:hypothetical protein
VNHVSDDERAAMRAFLQRCEVRLSTMHRAATALLSGAGILVLLPAVERDSIIQVMRSLLSGGLTWPRGLAAAGIAMSILLSLAALWLVIVELTRFYFHANHVLYDSGGESPGEVFTPRFTLTGLRLPSDELGPAGDAEYAAVHASEANVRLLVAGNERARAKIDRQVGAYPGLVDPALAVTEPDRARAEALFELAASRRRTLAEEVSKVEYGMVRHMVRLQVIILRYVKALLLIVVTTLTAFVCAAAVSGDDTLSLADQRWITGALLLWAPAAVLVVASPVRWLERVLRAEGATRTAVRNDTELTQVEDLTNRSTVAVWLAAAMAMVLLHLHHPVTAAGRVCGLGVLAGSAAVLAASVLRRRRR